ncbi:MULTISPECIES: hypothetical protein [unclassified Pseudoalteromonas]|uniref:hypothetical protein n=1 Tax=unclassified Pseudoalteromonas TaxID=194690 RepID=UPI000CF6567A|nr:MULTISPECIES: hypothetical protein [unclassified Pseudoalteromonas]
MKKLIFMALVLVSTSSFAKEFTINAVEMYEAGLMPGGPQVLIFNQQGKLVHHSTELNKQIVTEFKQQSDFADTQNIVEKLEKILGEPLVSGAQDYTVYSINMEAANPCPPCAKQNKFLNAALKKYADKKITHNKVHLSL